MSTSNDPKKKKDTYFTEPGEDQPPARDLAAPKKEGTERDKWHDKNSSFKLDPAGGEGVRNYEIEQRLAEAREFRKNAKIQKTFYDPDAFPDLLKGTAGAPQELSTQKITGSDIESLKDSALKGESAEVRMKQSAAAFLRGVGSTVSGMFSKTASKKTQCDLLGHRPPPPGWTGPFPRCVDCGTEIKSQAEMRRASAGQKDQEIKPYDNKLNL